MAPHFTLGSNQDDQEELISNSISTSISSRLFQLWSTISTYRKFIVFLLGGSILFFLIFNTIAYFEIRSSAISAYSRSKFVYRIITHPCPLEIQSGKIERNDSMSKGILARVISKPQALIHLDLGITPEFHFNELNSLNPSCAALPASIVGKSGSGSVVSLDTLGTCIRLYDKDGCYGNSTAVYPTTGIPSNFLHAAKSMSSCFQNELDASSFQYNSNTGFVHFHKKRRSNGDLLIPDELQVKERLVTPHPPLILPQYGTTAYLLGGPIKYYFWGHNNRLEFIEALFQHQHQNQNQQRNNETIDSTFPPISNMSENKEPRDDLGVYIPLKFNPQVKLSFYQTEENRREMEAVENGISEYLTENREGQVEARIDIHYDPETSTRPVRFFYWLKFGQRVQIFLISNHPD